MKPGIHPKYQEVEARCACGNTFKTQVDEAGAAPGNLQHVPPVLHGPPEADRHRRPRRAVHEAVRCADAGPARRPKRANKAAKATAAKGKAKNQPSA